MTALRRSRHWLGLLAILAMVGQVLLVASHQHEHDPATVSAGTLSPSAPMAPMAQDLTADVAPDGSTPAGEHEHEHDPLACDICLAAVATAAALVVVLLALALPTHPGPQVIAETRRGGLRRTHVRPFHARGPPTLAVAI